MNELKRNDLSVAAERALLVAVILPDSSADPNDPLGELRSLVRTAGGEIADEMVAKRQKIHPGYYVGSGKAEQIAQRAEQNNIDVIIFDNDLTPAQIRDLEKVTHRKIIDRSELILDIFAAHASTNEARLQVELAQLEYTYPRLRAMWSHLERITGGIGTRGPGEKQIETDRRLVQKRATYLKRQISQIDKRKVRQVRKRNKNFCVCLVGYTNAGKSTLMRRLTGSDVYIADKLFATLDTRTSRWDLDDGQTVLLSDTVGFVRDLPHRLVASFRATLEEAIHADLLLHVADASHPCVDQQIKAVDDVLDELECPKDTRMLVLNKFDRILDPTIITVLRQKYAGALEVSAVSGHGIESLHEAVQQRSGGGSVHVSLEADCRNGRLMQYIAQYAEVHQQTFEGTKTAISATMPAQMVEMLQSFGDDVAILCRS